jgi:hypothetical protein
MQTPAHGQFFVSCVVVFSQTPVKTDPAKSDPPKLILPNLIPKTDPTKTLIQQKLIPKPKSLLSWRNKV